MLEKNRGLRADAPMGPENRDPGILETIKNFWREHKFDQRLKKICSDKNK